MSRAQLDPKHQRFADEYLVDFNGGAAYERAGYKAKGAAAWAGASRLLARPDLQHYLAGRRAEMTEKLGDDADTALRNIVAMANGDIRCLVKPDGTLKPLQELSREEAALIQGFECEELTAGRGDDLVVIGRRYKYKLVNFVAARKLHGSHHNLFTKKVEHSGPGGGPIPHGGVVGDLLAILDGADTGPGAATSRRA